MQIFVVWPAPGARETLPKGGGFPGPGMFFKILSEIMSLGCHTSSWVCVGPTPARIRGFVILILALSTARLFGSRLVGPSFSAG